LTVAGCFVLEGIRAAMYVSYMKTGTYPLAMPDELLDEVRRTAKATGLSMADAMRQSMRLGLPKLREQLATASLKPLTEREIKVAFKRDKDWEAFEAAMTNAPVWPPEE
jgi:hypothetical protein